MVRQVRPGNLGRLEAEGWAKGRSSEEVQKRPSQELPLGHEDYFERKAIGTLWDHEKLLPLP